MSQIADIAGVSRGTVDRALHNREGINPQVREMVLSVAQSLNYRPNIAGRQLSARKMVLRFGFILPSGVVGFWGDVHRGIDAVAAEMSDFGVTVLRRTFSKYTVAEQMRLIDQLLDEGITGLAIVPMNAPAIQQKLNAIIASGIPVVVVNSDIENVEPLCYIGSDYELSGRTAAGIMGLVSKDRPVELIVFNGTENMLSHAQRITGFLQELTNIHPDCHLIDVYKLFDEQGVPGTASAYELVRKALQEHPETTAAFTAAGNVMAVARAIVDAGMGEKITHLAFDLNDSTLPPLRDGGLTAVIGQESVKQGYQPVKLLFDYLVNGISPANRRIILQNEIFIRQNAVLGPAVVL